MGLYYDKDNNLRGRITHSDIVYELKRLLGVTDDYRTRIIKYDSEPRYWKHACTYTGIGIQNPSVYSFLDGTTIKYTFCPVCRTIYYFLVTQGNTMQPSGYYNAGYNGNIGNYGYNNGYPQDYGYNNGYPQDYGYNNGYPQDYGYNRYEQQYNDDYRIYNPNGYDNDEWNNN